MKYGRWGRRPIGSTTELILPSLVAQRQDCEGRRGIGHELAGVGFRIALFVERSCPPLAARLLVRPEPGEPARYFWFVFRDPRSLQNVQNETGRVAIGRYFLRCSIFARIRAE